MGDQPITKSMGSDEPYGFVFVDGGGSQWKAMMDCELDLEH